ncbi:L-threonylcarbamoyladenylate synthase [Thermodesulfobacteriota bacterium B35]
MKVREDAIREAVRIIRAGGLIAYPTETYYGLGVDPGNRTALTRLFALKGRQEAKPVLVLVGDREQIGQLAAFIPQPYGPIMDRFWPGPVTLIFPARPGTAELLTGRTGTVGIRQSPHPCAARLLARLRAPLTATSANRSGEPPACTAEEIRSVFGHQVDLILDDGPTPGQRPSTLVGLEKGRLVCLRQGAVPFVRILAGCH